MIFTAGILLHCLNSKALLLSLHYLNDWIHESGFQLLVQMYNALHLIWCLLTVLKDTSCVHKLLAWTTIPFILLSWTLVNPQSEHLPYVKYLLRYYNGLEVLYLWLPNLKVIHWTLSPMIWYYLKAESSEVRRLWEMHFLRGLVLYQGYSRESASPIYTVRA